MYVKMKQTWTREIFPTTIVVISLTDFILPRLAWVDSLEAKHMSKLPENSLKKINIDNNTKTTANFLIE